MRSARLSPEESSAIAVVYTMFLAYVVFRDAKLRDFGKVIKNALKTLAIVMTLLATAKAFAYMMTELRIPAMITEVLLLSLIHIYGHELLRAGSPDGGRREQLFAALDSVFYRDG